jgi:hypothetical protein
VVIPVRDPGGLPLMLRGLPVVDEVIVVSEGPAGDTMAAVRAARPDVLVIRPGRSGAGNALASGLAASSGDVVVTLNGDGSTDPGEIPRYVAALTGGADVALGSRYRDGGGDLTGSRLRRWTDRVLIWVMNALFGTRRTDPGFGYAAFWRDALDRLELPDPSARHAAAWGDGPEIGPLLAVRPEARGLRVTEVGSVAYPRMGRPARAERTRVRHWIRVLAGEFAGRSGRHTAVVAASEALVAPLRPARDEDRAGFGPVAASTADPAADSWPDADRQDGAPLWGPPRRRPAPVRELRRDGENRGPHAPARPADNAEPPAWRAGHRQRAGRTDGKPRSAEDYRPDPASARLAPPQSHREVGGKRRRLESFRQRPDLRVINGEGAGTRRTRSGRLRPVHRENPG